MVIFGGIQGDEPGGFSAASLLTTHYKIEFGTLLIAPNLNFPSILVSSRGPTGDMNRKFSALDASDPQYHQVRTVQSLIMLPEVNLVLNLHDGSGFYRPRYESALANSARWGQSVIIDQATAPECFFPDLKDIAEKVVGAINAQLLDDKHHFFVKDTRTAEGNAEMEKTLSWFAVRNGKTAFGLEASKELGVVERTYYHLCMVEEFLRQADIRFTRTFPLTPQGVYSALSENIFVTFLDGKICLPLANVRPHIAGYLPLPKKFEANVSSPIMAVTSSSPQRERLQIHYGNNLLTNFVVQEIEFEDTGNNIEGHTVLVDGQKRSVNFGDIVSVNHSFNILQVPGYRVNVIGAVGKQDDESGHVFGQHDFIPKYSIDRSASIFRVETYKDNRFIGMFLVDFGEQLFAGPLPGSSTGTSAKRDESYLSR